MSNVTFPDVLLQSSDFGDFDLVLSPESFAVESENCKENFGADFDPDYTKWDKVEGKTDLYSAQRWVRFDGRNNLMTLTSQATWSELNGSFKLEEVDADLEDDQEVDDDLSAYTNSLLSFT